MKNPATVMEKTATVLYCDYCHKGIEMGMPNGVTIAEGSAIHGDGWSFFKGRFCSKRCFLAHFEKEARRLGLK